MTFTEAVARPGTAVLDRASTTFSFTPRNDDPLTVFWDVTGIGKYLRSAGVESAPMDLHGLSDWFETDRIEIDRAHAMGGTVDPRVPILAIRFDDGLLTVDGWHRIYRALRLGWKNIPALVLDAEEECRFRYPQSQCDFLRDLSQDPGYRVLEAYLEKAARSGSHVFVVPAPSG